MTKHALLVSVDYTNQNLPGREENISMMVRVCNRFNLTYDILFSPTETTFEVIKNKWKDITKGARSTDVFMFYFHGHGVNGNIQCADNVFDPSELMLTSNDYTNVTAIFNTCNAGATKKTEIHSIQLAPVYLASSDIGSLSYATKYGSILTLGLYSYCMHAKKWPSNTQVLEGTARYVKFLNQKFESKNITSYRISDLYVGSSPFLKPFDLLNQDSINAKYQDRFNATINFKDLYGDMSNLIFEPYDPSNQGFSTF